MVLVINMQNKTKTIISTALIDCIFINVNMPDKLPINIIFFGNKNIDRSIQMFSKKSIKAGKIGIKHRYITHVLLLSL